MCVDEELDLATKIDRTDEALDNDAADKIPTSAQTRQLMRAHVKLGCSPDGEFFNATRKWRSMFNVALEKAAVTRPARPKSS